MSLAFYVVILSVYSFVFCITSVISSPDRRGVMRAEPAMKVSPECISSATQSR